MLGRDESETFEFDASSADGLSEALSTVSNIAGTKTVRYIRPEVSIYQTTIVPKFRDGCLDSLSIYGQSNVADGKRIDEVNIENFDYALTGISVLQLCAKYMHISSGPMRIDYINDSRISRPYAVLNYRFPADETLDSGFETVTIFAGDIDNVKMLSFAKNVQNRSSTLPITFHSDDFWEKIVPLIRTLQFIQEQPLYFGMEGDSFDLQFYNSPGYSRAAAFLSKHAQSAENINKFGEVWNWLDLADWKAPWTVAVESKSD